MSARAEELRRGWFNGGVELSGVLWMAVVCYGRGSEEQANERAEWSAGVFVRLVRALGEGGRLCSELATAAARWRPRGRLWARRGAWHGRGALARAKEGGGEHQCDAWKPVRVKTWPGGLSTAPAAALCTAAARTEQRSWRKGKRTQTKFLKFPGTKL